MFGFLIHGKRHEVARILTSRLNHAVIEQHREGARTSARAALCEVVWLIPGAKHRSRDMDAAFPVVTRDISPRGLSLLHTAPVEQERIIVGLQDANGPKFVRCTLQHCTPLGFGFYQIGLYPEEVVALSRDEVRTLTEKMASFGRPATPV